MPTAPNAPGKAISRKKSKSAALVPAAPAHPQRAGRLPTPGRRPRLAARELFLYLPAMVDADTGVSGLFFHDSFEKYCDAALSSSDPQALKAQALALLSHRDQIEGRFLSALSDVLEWHRRLQELMEQGGLTAEEIGSGQ